LCIDPQLQAVNWIKKRYEGPTFKVLNMNEGPSSFIKDLENTIKRGGACLFENIDEELDPTIDPLLEKNIVERAGQKFIKLTDNFIDYNESFKLYFTTKLSNPKYTPEIMGKTMVINFTVTVIGLRDQLLNVVVAF
jgi:dynein heavy chain, axonemal